MSVYLDSALPDDARRAASRIAGVTTNPHLMRVAGRFEDVLPALCEVVSGTVFHQVDTWDEGQRARALHPRIGLKIPCTSPNLDLAARFVADGATVGITAIFDPAQVVLGCQVGAAFVLPYVNRSTRLLGDGVALVARMRAVIDAVNAPTRILAASLKGPDEVVATVLAGAHDVAVPLSLLDELGEHELSRAAIEDFRG